MYRTQAVKGRLRTYNYNLILISSMGDKKNRHSFERFNNILTKNFKNND